MISRWSSGALEECRSVSVFNFIQPGGGGDLSYHIIIIMKRVKYHNTKYMKVQYSC